MKNVTHKLVGLIGSMLVSTTIFVVPAALANDPAVPDLRMCTGGETGKYYQTAKELKAQLNGVVNVVPVVTNGSMDNLNQLSSGSCDAAIIQSDAYGFHVTKNPAAKLDFKRTAVLYPEYVHLVCNAEAGIKAVGDVRKDGITVLVGPNGSGTQVTWETWAAQDPNYAKVATAPEGGMSALSSISQGVDAQCALFVAGLGSGTMMEYDGLAGDSLTLVPVTDDWFDDVKDPKGAQVYKFSEIPANTYPSLQTSGWFGGDKTPTITLDAVLVTNSEWIDANPKGNEALIKKSLQWAATNNK